MMNGFEKPEMSDLGLARLATSINMQFQLYVAKPRYLGVHWNQVMGIDITIYRLSTIKE